MDTKNMSLSQWKAEFETLEVHAEYRSKFDFPVVINAETMLNYIQFTKGLIDKVLDQEEKDKIRESKEYDMRDYESHGFSADQKRKKNERL